MRKLLPLLAAVALLAGCSRNDGPAVNLVTVQFKDATLMETTADFVVRLSNDSPEARKFTGSAHKIYINDLYVGKGLNGDTIEVPRLGSVTQAITVHLSNLALATRLKAVIDSKKFEYNVRSTFFGDSLLSRRHSETSGKLAWEDIVPDSLTNNAAPAEATAPAPASEPPVIPPPPAEPPAETPAQSPTQ